MSINGKVNYEIMNKKKLETELQQQQYINTGSVQRPVIILAEHIVVNDDFDFEISPLTCSLYSLIEECPKIVFKKSCSHDCGVSKLETQKTTLNRNLKRLTMKY